MRIIACAAVLALAAGSAEAGDGGVAPPLPITTARALVAGAGINPGKVFSVDHDRYAVTGVIVGGGGTSFMVRITIRPLRRAEQ